MSSNAAPIYCAGSEFGDQRHVYAFFHSPEEKYRALFPFVKDGFDCGDRAFHVVDPDRRKEQHLQRLESAGIDTARAESSGQLKVCDWNENPFFVPPDKFLLELREKRVGQNQWEGGHAAYGSSAGTDRV